MESTDNQPVIGKRDQYMESLKKRYPDKQYESDDDLYGQAIEDNENYEKELNGYKERESGLANMFAKDRRVARFFSGVRKGESPDIMLVRLYGKDIADAADDPAKMEQIAAANQEYLDRIAKDTELEDEFKANIAQSIETLSSAGFGDDELDKYIEEYARMATDFIRGKISVDDIKMIQKAMNHDADVEDATQEGMVKGRNQRIVEKLRTKKAGDGLPNMASGGQMAMTKKPELPDMGVLNNYGDDSTSIWDRGGYKRGKKL